MKSRMTRIRGFFVPPVFPGDEEKTRTAKVLNTLLLAMMLFLIFIGAIVVPFVFVEKLYNSLLVIAFFLALTVARWLMRRGRVRFASVVSVSALWIICTAFLPFAGGMTSIAAVFYVSGTVIAGLLLGTRAALINALASIGAGLVMVILESSGYFPPRLFPIPALVGWVDLTLSLLLTTAVLSLVLCSLNDALALARRQVDDRKKAEEALRRERDVLDRITDTSPAGIVVVNHTGQITFANAQAERVLGLTKDEITQRTYDAPGWHITDYDGGPFPDVQLPFQQVMDTGQPVWDVRHAIERPDGRRVLLSINAAPLLDEAGQVDGMVATLEGITEQAQAAQALKESEERYRSLVEFGEDMIFSVDRAGVFHTAGGRRLSEYGLTPDDVVGQSLAMLAGEEADLYHARHRQVFESGESLTYEHTFEFAGITRTDLTTIYPIKYEQGHVELVGVICRDISERKRAADGLQKSEQFLQNVFDAIQDGISVLDTDLSVIRTNTWMERMYAHQMPLAGRKCYEAYQGRRLPCPWCPTLRTIETGEMYTQIVPYPSADEPQGWIELSTFPIKDEQGHVTNVIEYVKDITERKRAEEALRRRTEQLEALRQVGLEIAAHLDLDSLLQSIVSRAVDLLEGTSGGIYLYRPKREVLEWVVTSGSGLTPLGSVLQRGEGLAGKVWETGEPLIVHNYQAWEGRARAYDAYGYTAVLGVPIRWGDEFLGVLDVLADAPRRFSPADAELLTLLASQAAIAIQNARLFEDLQRRMAELQQTQGQLIQSAKMAAIGELAAGVAHELNNPLTSVLGFAELLLRNREQDDSTRENLSIIVHEARRARQIVRNLLEFSRQTGSFQEKADINEALRDTLNLLRRQLRINHVELEEDYAQNLPFLRLAAGRIKQVFFNLITNALQAMPRGGTLTVSSRQVGGEVAVSFVDTGVGIAAEKLARIFEPFFTTKPVGQGTGLGLSVSLGIVQEHGGRITVESQVDEGSTFTVWLPVDTTLEVHDGR